MLKMHHMQPPSASIVDIMWNEYLQSLIKIAEPYGLRITLDRYNNTAFHKLNQLTPDEIASTIIIADGRTPEYLSDLWECLPAILIGNLVTSMEFQILLEQYTRNGRTLWGIPTTPLTPAERRSLRLIAQGHSNKHIAEMTSLSERTIQNTVCRIFEKLTLSNRTEAALYYWGLNLARVESTE